MRKSQDFTSTITMSWAVAAAVVAALVVGSGCVKKGVSPSSSTSTTSSGASALSVSPVASPVAPLVDAKQELRKEMGTVAPGAAVVGAQAPGSTTGAVAGAAGAVGVAAGTGTPGTPGAPGALPGGVLGAGAGKTAATQEPQAAPKPVVPEQECFSFSYRHKSTAGHTSEEACSHHQNVIKLKHAKINKESLCVKVNGNPVKYQWVKGSSDEVLIGNVAGPNAKIETRYCLGKVKCGDGCTIPRDEFLDAIGGGVAEGQAQAGKWDAGGGEENAKLDAQVKAELATFEDKESVFKDWVGDDKSLAENAVCTKIMGSRQALRQEKK